MILAFDTYYIDNNAMTVCISFENWQSEDTLNVYNELVQNSSEYISGEFYKRELPCILSLLDKIEIKNVEAIIVDGFVHLDDNKKFGLGAHLYQQLKNKIPVIGVAKTDFKTINKTKRLLLRGKSLKPLYITSIGIDIDEATKYIEAMSGKNRLPTLLKKLDTLTKVKTAANSGFALCGLFGSLANLSYF